MTSNGIIWTTDEVRSADGTTIAYETAGDGPPIILVGGAFNDRSTTRPLATELAADFSVYGYDRRGRGGSGDTAPYAVQREIEDVAALIDRRAERPTSTASPPARSSPRTWRPRGCR